MSQRPRMEICKSNHKVMTDEKSWKPWKSYQKIVMNAELVQNFVMDEELIGPERRDE